MNSITQFKYKKPTKIHHSNFTIFSKTGFYCANGCQKSHCPGQQRITLQCVEYFLKWFTDKSINPITSEDVDIFYTGCLEELIEYIIYSGVVDTFVNQKSEKCIITRYNSCDLIEEDSEIYFNGWPNEHISGGVCGKDEDDGYFSLKNDIDDSEEYDGDNNNCDANCVLDC